MRFVPNSLTGNRNKSFPHFYVPHCIWQAGQNSKIERENLAKLERKEGRNSCLLQAQFSNLVQWIQSLKRLSTTHKRPILDCKSSQDSVLSSLLVYSAHVKSRQRDREVQFREFSIQNCCEESCNSTWRSKPRLSRNQPFSSKISFRICRVPDENCSVLTVQLAEYSSLS